MLLFTRLLNVLPSRLDYALARAERAVSDWWHLITWEWWHDDDE